MKRGDIVTFAERGNYGKPRPAIVIQTDLLPPSDSVLLCLLTSDDDPPAILRRIAISPSPLNGLKRPSQIMTEKILAVRRDHCGPVIGRVEPDTMEELNDALAVVIGLAD